jgi:hypothetical protein
MDGNNSSPGREATRYAHAISPQHILQRSEQADRCATLTNHLVQKVGQTIGSLILSVFAGKLASRWWYLATGVFVLTYIAIAGGMAMLER